MSHRSTRSCRARIGIKQREKQAPRKLGDWVPSSYEIGNEMVQQYDLQKPTYATTPIIRSTFYRVGNLRANSGWAALPGTAN